MATIARVRDVPRRIVRYQRAVFRDRRKRARFGSYEAETKQPINQFSAGTIHPMRSE